jgi:carbon-monoxide dehydrogenase medium subunit
VDGGTLAAAGRALDADLDPPSDVHASAALRRHLARVLLGRALTRLIEDR